jgi:replicative DNA helicase
LDIPIIALSQLNRGVEGRTGIEGKRPQLSDLRESGAIEQDADMVCFIHRPEYYKITEDAQGNSLLGIAEIIVAKHRNGATADVQLKFKNTYAKFMNKDDMADDDNPFGSEFQIISSKMNDNSGDAYPAISPNSIPPGGQFPGGRNDETPF